MDRTPSTEPVERIPERGLPREELLGRLEAMRSGDADWKGGRVFSLVYTAGDEHLETLKRASELYFSENGLNPMAFQSLRRMESDVVRMATELLHGPPTTVGTLTSGGTESILLAVKTARDRARRKRPWIRRPEIVLPETAHVAFDKAAHYFGLKIRFAPLKSDWRVDVDAYRKLINRNTVLLVASAPQYPHGVIDPISEIAAIARKKRLPFHVDACVGGFILPWLEQLGHPLPLWDFRVAGVTSISADLHKYGFAAKGASVLLHVDMEHMKDQFFISTDWSGGVYAGPSVTGTRPGGPIAAAWATMMALGKEGYLHHARRTLDAAKRLHAGLAAIDGLEVMGPPDATIVTWRTVDPQLSTFAVADVLKTRGWHVDRQHRPDSVHLTVMSHHLEVVDDYLRDVREAVAHVRAHPELKGSGEAAMYGVMAKVPVRGMVKKAVLQVMQQMYSPGGAAPDLSGGGGGALDEAVAKYAPRALELLDKVDVWRTKVGLSPRGRR
jgi:sphinganine-1-phosphate aldolase